MNISCLLVLIPPADPLGFTFPCHSEAAKLVPKPPNVPFFSTVSGGRHTEPLDATFAASPPCKKKRKKEGGKGKKEEKRGKKREGEKQHNL
jgi:hypothetical protein